MRVQDLVKLSSNGYFKIFRINRITEEKYILKIFENSNFPKWNVLLTDCTFQKCLEKVRFLRSQEVYPLLISDRITTFDLIEISKRGYRILKEEEYNGIFYIEEFQSATLSWKKIESFTFISEVAKYLNFQLLHPYTICL